MKTNDIISVNFSDEIFNTHFPEVFKSQERYLHLWGGASSGKSNDAVFKLLIRAMQEPNHRFLYVRKVFRTLRQSCFQLFKEVIHNYNLSSLFVIKEGDLTIKCINGSEFIPAGLDDVEKLKSIQNITGIWIEEATECSKEDLMQLDVRMRSSSPYYQQIILTYNPKDINSHLKAEWHDKTQPNSKLIWSTYKDNKFLIPSARNVLENLVNLDIAFYKIYCKGEWAQISGLIYPNYTIDNYFPQQYSVYGLDFGFEHPTALIETTIIDKNAYVKNYIYESGLNQSDLIIKMRSLGLEQSKELFVSPERADLIDLLKNSGFNAKPAKTGAGSVFDGIMFCKQFQIHVAQNNTELINEFLSYKWKTDKEGNPVTPEQPVKFKDDGVDAFRYGLYSGFCDKISFGNSTGYNSIIKNKNRVSLTMGF